MKVFITRKLPGEPEKILRHKGFKVEVYQKNNAIPRKEFKEKTKDVDAVITLLTEKIDKEIIDNFTNCKIIANWAVGFNNVDVEYAKSKNIIVTNTPDVLTDATADLASALLLSCARRLFEGENMIRTGNFTGFKPHILLGQGLNNKTLGIIGAGRIGFATAKRLQSFGMKIIYYDRNIRLNFEKTLRAKKTSLKNLMLKSDFVSIHLSLSKSTENLLNQEMLSLLKPTAILINTSRGEILDEKFLIKLLKRKRLFAAGLDVYRDEPNINPEFLKLNNVVLLPHIGSATIEARTAMSYLAAKNVTNVLLGKKPVTSV